jgi:fucose 4-O-acetylase-like acetyltransferase
MQPTAQPATAAPERYYSFDALRSAMMALGIVIHSATAYSTLPDVWWIKDAQTSKWMDAVLLFLHTFRLPAFFVMAGFFAALLVEKRGWQKMIENRMMRLGLPMILGVLLIWTPLELTSVYFHFAAKGGDTWAQWASWLQRGNLSEDIEPGHFWFLETLIWVTLLALVFRNWLARLGGKWFERLMGRRLCILLLTLATGATLLISEFGILDTPHDFSPHWHIVAAYGVFYSFGWGMYLHRDSLWRMRRFGWKEIVVALLLMIPALTAIEAQLASRGTRVWGAYAATALLSAAMGWLVIYGLIGIFLRRFSANDRRVRYLSDSAYWMYIMHPIVLLTIQVPMMRFDWSPWVKFVIGIVYALPVLLITYDRLARPTWVGLVLNGKRMERWSRSKVPETGVDTGRLTAVGQMEG